MKPHKNPALRLILIVAGTIFLALGVIGIFLPILPTTPFLLAAAACYIRSSERLYTWLTTNRIFGAYISNYIEGKGIPLRVKASAIAFLWATILITMIFFVQLLWVRVILIIVAVTVTAHILMLKTLNVDRTG